MAKVPYYYYIYDLPFQPRRELCNILDADHQWETLGGMYMDIDITTLTLIGQAVQRDKSPTCEVLNKWGEKNGTITQVFFMLSKMGHLRGMKILQPYVDKSYHKYMQPENMLSSRFMTNFTEGDLPKPQYSTSLASFSSNLSTHTYNRNSNENNAHLAKHEGHASAFSKSKFVNDVVNINHSHSTLSLKSKLNSLNVHQPSKNQHPAGRKSPDARHTKHEEAANCREESITDNCISEKIKNVRKTFVDQSAVFQEEKMKPSPPKNCADNLNSVEENLPDVMKISYKDILKATNDFDKSRILGRGGFGTVYKGEWKGTSVAIKRLAPRDGHDSDKQVVSLKQSLNELNILKCCRFDHILPLYGVSLDGSDPCLVYQLMVNGSLEDRLLCRAGTPPLTWSQRSNIAECTTKGLNYLHTTPGKPLVHGDVKSANILLDNNMEAKIGDFGLTREGPGCDYTHVKVSKLHGTECYLPPEYLRQRHLSPQVDVYSYGIVLLEMATGLRPYDVKRDEAKFLVDYVSDCDTSGRIDSLRDAKAGEENMMWFRELIQVGQKCSSKEKKKRPTMQMVLDHFKKVKEDISMMDKIRRLSNDKGSLGDTTKLRELTPEELQAFYDICKDRYGTVPCDASFLPVTGVQNIQGPPSDTVHVSEIRAPPSLDVMDHKGVFVVPTQDGSLNSSCAATAGSCQSIESIRSNNSTNAEDQSPEAKVPLPLLTVLQLQVSDTSENNSNVSCNSNSENVNSSVFSNLSSGDYSMELALAMASVNFSDN